MLYPSCLQATSFKEPKATMCSGILFVLSRTLHLHATEATTSSVQVSCPNSSLLSWGCCDTGSSQSGTLCNTCARLTLKLECLESLLPFAQERNSQSLPSCDSRWPLKSLDDLISWCHKLVKLCPSRLDI